MQRTRLFTILGLISGSLLLSACGSDSTDQVEENLQQVTPNSEGEAQTIIEEEIKPVEIPKDEVREENLKNAAAASPFAKLGCCSKEESYGDDCCCDEVIETYRTMVNAQDTSIARLKMTDPILSTCRKKHQSVFDKIDYPEDDYEDMVGAVINIVKET